VKKPDVEVLGWHGYTLSTVVRPVGYIAKFSKMFYGRAINITFSLNSSGKILAVSMPIAHSLTERSVALCCVTKLCILLSPAQGAPV
jgi:hypothetical protein